MDSTPGENGSSSSEVKCRKMAVALALIFSYTAVIGDLILQQKRVELEVGQLSSQVRLHPARREYDVSTSLVGSPTASSTAQMRITLYPFTRADGIDFWTSTQHANAWTSDPTKLALLREEAEASP